RGLAHSVTFVTGHVLEDRSLDWSSLAAPRHTVVFYMGVAHLPSIVAKLRAAGAPADHPAAIIEQATLPQQRILRGPLATARAIVADAERRGELPPGGTVVEGTAGNTGIGLAHVCNERGYRCVIVMPDNQSPEKYRLLEMLGAEVHRVPTVPYSNPNQYQKVAQRLAAALPNAIWANQFDNTATRDAH